MKAHSFTNARGRPIAEPDPGINVTAMGHQYRALGCEPHLDRKTGILSGVGWHINEDGRREEVVFTEPQRAQWPMGILSVLGLATQMQVIACGMHTWAHAVAFGRRSTALLAIGAGDVSSSLTEADGEPMGRLSELSIISGQNEVCRAAIHRSYMEASKLLMKRGAHVHGAINSMVVYEVRPSWWLDGPEPERSAGYRWTKSGLAVLEKHWPATVNRLHQVFCS